MGIERHCNGSSVDLLRLFDDLMKKRLMSDVNAIKIANGDDRIFKWPVDTIQTVDKFHVNIIIPKNN
jgi:hypothetical protein